MLAICGMLNPIEYTAMLIVRGLLLANYSHIRYDISSLLKVYATTVTAGYCKQ